MLQLAKEEPSLLVEISQAGMQPAIDDLEKTLKKNGGKLSLSVGAQMTPGARHSCRFAGFASLFAMSRRCFLLSCSVVVSSRRFWP